VDDASLGVLSSNDATLKIYRSLGFRAQFSRRWYEKSVEPRNQEDRTEYATR